MMMVKLAESEIQAMGNDELIEAHQESWGYDAFCSVFGLKEQEEANKEILRLLKKEIAERFRI